MAIEIKAPVFPESVADGTVATWHKKPGEAVARDELIVDIETDKVVLEVVAPADGVISQVLKNEGDTVLSQEVLALFEAGAAAAPAASVAAPAATVAAAEPVAATDDALSPAVRKLIAENNLDPARITGTGKGGRLTKEDVESHLKKPAAPVAAPAAVPAPPAQAIAMAVGDRVEKRVPMTRLRAKVAERLLEAKQSTAMLTTFNEVNMKPIMDIRKQYQDIFEKRHGIRLGFMSFYVKAVTEALKRFPEVNASIDGDDIVYHNYFDVSIAVSTPRGLVTPVLRDTDTMSLADIEKAVRDLAIKGRDGKLTVADMTGGNFTVTNGGVFGSLMSTPILNLPQSAILGMHAIKDRPMAVNGQVEILPMMYLALSYDHRIIDGRESVGFLVAIKDFLEDPTRLLLDL